MKIHKILTITGLVISASATTASADLSLVPNYEPALTSTNNITVPAQSGIDINQAYIYSSIGQQEVVANASGFSDTLSHVEQLLDIPLPAAVWLMLTGLISILNFSRKTIKNEY